MTNQIAAALANYANVQRALVMSWDVKPSNIEAAIAYATQDIYNSVKHMDEANAVAIINDDALYIQEKMAQKEAA